MITTLACLKNGNEVMVDVELKNNVITITLADTKNNIALDEFPKPEQDFLINAVKTQYIKPKD